jgi:hypothetical protein
VLNSKILLNSIPVFLLFMMTGSICAAKHKPDEGLKQISLLNYRKAAAIYKDKMDDAKPDSPEWRKNAFLYAVSLMRRLPDRAGDKLEAAEVLDKLILAGSKAAYYDGALLFRGKLAEQIDYYGDTPDFTGAYKYYDTLVKECPKSKYRDYAVFCRAQVEIYSMDKKRVKIAIVKLRNWLKKHPKNNYAVAEWYLISSAAMYPLKDYKLALSSLMEIEKNGLPSSMVVDNFYWRTGRVAMQAGNMAVATAFFKKILKLERSRFGTVSKDMLKKIEREGK